MAEIISAAVQEGMNLSPSDMLSYGLPTPVTLSTSAFPCLPTNTPEAAQLEMGDSPAVSLENEAEVEASLALTVEDDEEFDSFMEDPVDQTAPFNLYEAESRHPLNAKSWVDPDIPLTVDVRKETVITYVFDNRSSKWAGEQFSRLYATATPITLTPEEENVLREKYILGDGHFRPNLSKATAVSLTTFHLLILIMLPRRT